MMHLPSSSIMEWLRSQIVLKFSFQPHSLLFLSCESFKAEFTYLVFNMGNNTYWQDCHPFSFPPFSMLFFLFAPTTASCLGCWSRSLVDLPPFWYSLANQFSLSQNKHPQSLWNITPCLWQLFPNNYPSQELGYHPTSVSFSPSCWSGATSCWFCLLGVSHICLAAPSLCCRTQVL